MTICMEQMWEISSLEMSTSREMMSSVRWTQEEETMLSKATEATIRFKVDLVMMCLMEEMAWM